MRLLVRLAALTLAVAVLGWLLAGRRREPEPVRAGGRLDIARCPLHGIAYDRELEACPECARLSEPDGGGAGAPALDRARPSR
jgi:hypothetical protein